jgi:hypothetical protein
MNFNWIGLWWLNVCRCKFHELGLSSPIPVPKGSFEMYKTWQSVFAVIFKIRKQDQKKKKRKGVRIGSRQSFDTDEVQNVDFWSNATGVGFSQQVLLSHIKGGKFNTRNQSYDLEFQRRRCKNLQYYK